MNGGITYSFLNHENDSSRFYDDLSLFTELVINGLDKELIGYIEEFNDFVHRNKVEPGRPSNEYVFEVLMIGLYWNDYSGNALKTENPSRKLLKILYKQRKKFPTYKAEIDKVRGFLAYLFLEKHSYTLSANFSKKGFFSLLDWLSASGEFKEEVLRLRNWVSFCKTKDESYIVGLLETAVLFAE